MKIAHIVAALPPKFDGIGDYTASLAGEMAASHQVSALTSHNYPFDPLPGVSIEPLFRIGDPKSFDALDSWAHAEAPDWMILQYQCFAYGRRGLNLRLPRVMGRIARRAGKTRFALMVHEPSILTTDLRAKIMRSYQLWQLRSLGRSAHAVFFSIDAWRRQYGPWFPRGQNFHLPVMSNIPRLDTDRAAIRKELGLSEKDFAIGLFGYAHVSRALHRTHDAARGARQAGLNPVLLYIGAEGHTVRQALGDLAFLDQGALSRAEVSRRFAAMDLYVSAFADGISTRRTSLMTALQHGVPVVGTTGALTDSVLAEQRDKAIRLVPIEDGEGLAQIVRELAADPAGRETLGQEGRRFYERTFAPPVVARRQIEILEGVPR